MGEKVHIPSADEFLDIARAGAPHLSPVDIEEISGIVGPNQIRRRQPKTGEDVLKVIEGFAFPENVREALTVIFERRNGTRGKIEDAGIEL